MFGEGEGIGLTGPLVSQLVSQETLLISNAPEGLGLLSLPHTLGLSHLSLCCGCCILLHNNRLHFRRLPGGREPGERGEQTSNQGVRSVHN